MSLRKTSRKRRIDDIDDRIDCLTKVINTIEGYKRPYFDLKLMGVQLKKQKLITLTSFTHAQKMQAVLAEMDFLVAENDLIVEIEAIMKSKKFRKTKEVLRIRENGGEDPDATKIIEPISSHSTPKTKSKNSDRASLTKRFPNISESEEDKENNPFNYIRSRKITDERRGNAFSKARDAISKQKLRTSRFFFGKNQNNENTKNLVKENEVKRTIKTFALNESSRHHLNNKIIEPSAIIEKKSRKKPFIRHTKSLKRNDSATSDPVNVKISKNHTSSQGKAKEVINKSTSNALVNETHTFESKKEMNVETTPATNGTHRNVINLYRTYKKIYSPEVSTANKIILSHEKAYHSVNSKENMDTESHGVLEKVIKIGESMANITGRLKKIYMTDDSSKLDKVSYKSDEITANTEKSNASKNSKSEDLTKKIRRRYTKKNRGVPKTQPTNLEENIKNLNGDDKIISYMTTQVNKSLDEETLESKQKLEESVIKVAMEKRETKQNDTLNSIICDILDRQVKKENTSDRMTTCVQCGSVYEGHMCAFTIRELLEHC